MGTSASAGPDHRKVACRVAEAFVLLVRGVVFLVHDDEGKLGQGGEYRRPRADDDPRLAAVRRTPGIAPLRGREG